MSLEVIILAAGKGTRMRSSLPKVLHKIAGRPMLSHVVDRACELSAHKIHVVIGHGAEEVRKRFTGEQMHWVLQEQQLGTGHAVLQVMPHLDDDSVALVLYGDVPLIRAETLNHLVDLVDDKHMSLLTVHLDDPGGYGRIIRDEHGDINCIVEHKDALPEQLAVHEVNTGILCARASHLKDWLPRLSNKNAQGEYYLTDIIGLATSTGVRVRSANPDSHQEVEGANDRVQLAELERWYQARTAERLMRAGAALADPARVDVRGNVEVGEDVEIDINCIFYGRVVLQSGVKIGANCVLRDVEIGANTVVHENCLIESSQVGENCSIGPFARLRPGSQLSANARIGNFVETKNAQIGESSKVNHLSYIGDATIGSGANVGAGTITCNYDGANKHQTEIGDDAFIGSNSSLVAPVRIGDGATVGAGSTVGSDVPAGSLAVARSKQRNISDWVRPKKK